MKIFFNDLKLCGGSVRTVWRHLIEWGLWIRNRPWERLNFKRTILPQWTCKFPLTMKFLLPGRWECCVWTVTWKHCDKSYTIFFQTPDKRPVLTHRKRKWICKWAIRTRIFTLSERNHSYAVEIAHTSRILPSVLEQSNANLPVLTSSFRNFLHSRFCCSLW
jgi:hypothetical protein